MQVRILPPAPQAGVAQMVRGIPERNRTPSTWTTLYLFSNGHRAFSRPGVSVTVVLVQVRILPRALHALVAEWQSTPLLITDWYPTAVNVINDDVDTGCRTVRFGSQSVRCPVAGQAAGHRLTRLLSRGPRGYPMLREGHVGTGVAVSSVVVVTRLDPALSTTTRYDCGGTGSA